MPPDGNGLIARNVPLQRLVQFAFDLRIDELVFGGPDWSRSERFDVMAKVAEPDLRAYHELTVAQQRAMLQHALERRCGMVAHLAPKEMPVYALVVAKHGPKMKELGAQNSLPEPPLGPNGERTHEDPIFLKRGEIRSEGVSLRALALALSSAHLGRPVIDQTGLAGTYMFDLQWEPEQETSGAIAQIESKPAGQSVTEGIFPAIEHQLGLRLIPVRSSMMALQIERLERPSEN